MKQHDSASDLISLSKHSSFMEMSFKILVLCFVFSFLNSVSAQQVSGLTSIAEQRALLDLRSSLGISAKDWRKKANPCVNWTGIECRNGRVVGINLSGIRRNRIARLNPRFSVDSLSSFSLLSKLNSSGFSLRGPIPEFFGQKLNNLEVLDLRSSSVSGPIPSSLGNLNKLGSLYLSNNSIAGTIPVSMGNLSSLSVLDLSQNFLTGQIPITLSNIRNLTNLDLSSNFLSGPIPIGFSSLSRLRYLNLSSNSLSSTIPAQLGKLANLIELDLGSNSLFGLLPEELGGLRSLRKMSIGNNELEGSLLNALFANLSGLEYLVVASNNFIGALPNAVGNLPNLKFLDVSYNNLTGPLPSFDNLSNATSALSLNFSNNLFYGNLSPAIAKFNTIDLSSNYFEGLAPNRTIVSNNCFFGLDSQRDLRVCCDFYSNKQVSFGNDTTCKMLESPLFEEPAKRRNKLAYLMIGIFGGLGLIIVVITAVLLILKACKNSNSRTVQRAGNEGAHGDLTTDLPSLGESFTYDQILLATRNFDNENLIKHGHSGDLYRGMLENGLIVVVKRADHRKIKKELWTAEIDLYSRVAHPSLVPLVGYCSDNENEKILVYKHMSNGDLYNSLYNTSKESVKEEENDDSGDARSLDWITRLKIAIDTAKVLCFLHHECNPTIVHRDVQASSILLDDKYEVGLGSLSEACSQGAAGTVISRLLEMPQTSLRKHPSGSSSSSSNCAYDVYCFGRILLELVTGKLGLIGDLDNSSNQQHLERHVLPFIDIHEKEHILKIVDKSLIIDDGDLLEEVWAVSIVAKSCLNPKASRRPSMRHVLRALENPFKVVRGENFSSSRQSLALAFFGSWNRSSSDGSGKEIIIGSLRKLGSRGSGGNEHSSMHKRSSSDVFPEPAMDVEKQEDGTDP